MGLASLSNVLKIFGGDEPSDAERQDLFKEIMLMTLARATSADANIEAVEIEQVRSALKNTIGEDISDADIRVAAASQLYESAPLDKYLAQCGKKLTPAQRAHIATSLAELIKSDSAVRSMEVDFFNSVVEALKVTPAQLAGLIED